ncbi:MAG: S41 family peptidase, partial [Pseudobdellovibrionaceae bacterium]
MITDLVPGGPAFNSGLIEPKDMIISVGQENGKVENVVDLDLKDVVSKIRGKKGTKVTLTILRKQGDGKKRFEITIVRDKIKLEDSAAKMTYIHREINGQKKKIGVLNLPSFYAPDNAGKDKRTASMDVKRLLLEAKSNGTEGIVFDLSTNGGGSLTDAVEIAGLFFKTGNVVKQSSRYEAREEGTLADTDPAVVWNGPLVVLTSRFSASASEIVAGALQDYKRAVIVGGDHTWGKGTIQTVRPVPGDRGALKVTIGMFFIPGGYSTQHSGVT